MKRSILEIAKCDGVLDEHSSMLDSLCSHAIGTIGSGGGKRRAIYNAMAGGENTLPKNETLGVINALNAIPVFECLCEYLYLGDIVRLFTASSKLGAHLWCKLQHVLRQAYLKRQYNVHDILPKPMRKYATIIPIDYLYTYYNPLNGAHSTRFNFKTLYNRCTTTPISFGQYSVSTIHIDLVMLLCTGMFASPREAMRYELVSAVIRGDVLHATRLIHHYGVQTSFKNHLCLRIAVENLNYCMCDLLLKKDIQGALANDMQWIRILDRIYTRKCSFTNRSTVVNICLLFFRHISPVDYFKQPHTCTLNDEFIQNVLLPVASIRYPPKMCGTNKKLHEYLENSLNEFTDIRTEKNFRKMFSSAQGNWKTVGDEARQYLKNVSTSST